VSASKDAVAQVPNAAIQPRGEESAGSVFFAESGFKASPPGTYQRAEQPQLLLEGFSVAAGFSAVALLLILFFV
jgi:hypothetical protein